MIYRIHNLQKKQYTQEQLIDAIIDIISLDNRIKAFTSFNVYLFAKGVNQHIDSYSKIKHKIYKKIREKCFSIRYEVNTDDNVIAFVNNSNCKNISVHDINNNFVTEYCSSVSKDKKTLTIAKWFLNAISDYNFSHFYMRQIINYNAYAITGTNNSFDICSDYKYGSTSLKHPSPRFSITNNFNNPDNIKFQFMKDYLVLTEE